MDTIPTDPGPNDRWARGQYKPEAALTPAKYEVWEALEDSPHFPVSIGRASRAAFREHLEAWFTMHPEVTPEQAQTIRAEVWERFAGLPADEWAEAKREFPWLEAAAPATQTPDEQRQQTRDYLWQFSRGWVELCTTEPRISEAAKAELYNDIRVREWVWTELAYQRKFGEACKWVPGSVAAAIADLAPPEAPEDPPEGGGGGGGTQDPSHGATPNGKSASHPSARTESAAYYRAADLETADLPPLTYLVAALICTGVIALVGRPKIGKSWMALMIAIAVATDGRVLGQRIGTPGSVLYVGLEDSPRRMKSRLTKLGAGFPERLSFMHKLPLLDDGGISALDSWCDQHPDAALIVIDTIGKCRGQRGRNEEPYQYDVRTVGMLQDLASRHGVSVILCHHQRKADAADIFDTASGTLGFTGTVDTTLIVGKTEKGVRLVAQSRDNEAEVDKLVEFNRANAQWRIVGEYESASRILNPLQRRIVAHLETIGSGMPADIADHIGEPRDTVKHALARMAKGDSPVVLKSQDKPGAYVIAKPTWNYNPFRDGLTIDGERIEDRYKGRIQPPSL